MAHYTLKIASLWLVILVFCISSAGLNPSYAQTDSLATVRLSLSYEAHGSVVDGESGKPLESVYVSIPGKYFATVTNADGQFSIKSDTPVDEVVLTYLGYQTIHVKMGNGAVKVLLQRIATPLTGAQIVTGDPEDIVKTAIAMIYRNYSKEPELLESFYRETIRKRQRFTYISEATAKLYKTPYTQSVYRDRAALLKCRTLLSQRKRDTLSVKMLGGPAQALTLDIVKNPEILFDDLSMYRLSMLPPEFMDGRGQFVIGLDPAVVYEYPLYHGKLYIDQESLAFTRIELSLDMSDPVKATKMMVIKKPAALRFKPSEMSIVLSYRSEGGVSRLQYFKTVLGFSCDWRKKLFATQYRIVNELVVTDLYPEAIPIQKTEAFRIKDALSDKADEFADPGFWSGYNIIAPTESLEHAIDRLKK